MLYSELNLEQRIHEIHQTAFSRPASASEISGQSGFSILADEYGSSLDDLAVWADLCRPIYNRKEFIYVFRSGHAFPLLMAVRRPAATFVVL